MVPDNKSSLNRLQAAPEAHKSGALSHVQPFVASSSARAFQRDLFFYWSAVHAQPASLTKQGRLYRKDLRRINASLLQPEPIEGTAQAASEQIWSRMPSAVTEGPRDEPDIPRLLFLRLLMTDLGLLRCSKQSVRAIERPSYLALDAAARIQLAFKSWRDGSFWNEAQYIPGISIRGIESPTSPAPNQIVDARQRVLYHVTELGRETRNQTTETGQAWLSFERLIATIQEREYEFMFPRLPRHRSPSDHKLDPSAPYREYIPERSPYISYGNRLGWSISPPFETPAEGWEIVEAGFIQVILLQPLYWMGLVDIGYVAEEAVAFRLTPVGAWILGVGPEVELPEQEGRIIVQPNFEIFALDPISDQALTELDTFAERASGERAIKYRLTRESVYRAQKRGWSVRRILDTLERLTQGPETGQEELPQNVVRTLQDWQQLYERITIRRSASLVQATDAELLQRLAQDQEVRRHLAAPAQEQVHSSALVARGLGQTEDLVQALERLGYPPARTRYRPDGQPTLSAARCLYIAEDGELIFDIPLPSIYTLQQVAPFTTYDPQTGRRYLEQGGVKRALKGGMTVTGILDRLQKLYIGPLPRWVEIQVRAWGNYYGSAAIQEITLVQVRDQAILEELLAEPELHTILHRFIPPSSRALAWVSARDLDALLQAFADRGIKVEGQISDLSPGPTNDQP